MKKDVTSPNKLTKSKRKAAKEAIMKSKRRKVSRTESAEEDSGMLAQFDLLLKLKKYFFELL